MKRYDVILEPRALEAIDTAYQRAVAAGGESHAARWFDRIEAAILSLEVLPEGRGSVPEQGEFSEKLHQLIFEHRYRIIFTVDGDRVHVLCVRGPEVGPLRSREFDWPDFELEFGA